MANINDTYFEGHYKEIWKAIIPEELTKREAEFLLNYFQLNPDQKVLDIMCGYGRHAISLGRAGISVVAIDNLADYINEVDKVAQNESLPVKAIRSGILEFKTNEQFDLAICMGNSLNFFNASDTLAILKNISASLKPGGSLLINTWSLAEIAYRQFNEESDGVIGKLKIVSTSKFYFSPNRIESETSIYDNSELTETKKAIDYIFSINEIENLLSDSGFELSEIYSIPGRKKFALGDPRAYIIAKANK